MLKEPVSLSNIQSLRNLSKEALIELVVELLENRESSDQRYKALLKKLYGRSSEQFTASEEQLLLDFMNQSTVQKEKKPEQDVEIKYKRKVPKKANKRLPIPADLPRRKEYREPENIPEDARKIGEEITEVLAYEPAEIYVQQIIRPKYVTKEEEFIIAPLSLPFPKSNVDASLLAHLLVSKFVDHLPFHRLIQIFSRLNIRIASSTIDNWQTAGCQLLLVLYEKLKNILQETHYLMADETTIDVLRMGKPKGTKAYQGYHWVYYAPLIKLAYFEYQPGRGKQYPKQFLAPFQGILQTDAYGGYNQFNESEKVTMLACWAHARRKFHEALGNDRSRAQHALELIQQLYEVERKAKEEKMIPEKRQKLRAEKSTPILKEIKTWLDSQITQVLPKSKIGEAMAYTLKLWPKLEAYAQYGECEIDNNWIENSIRPIALGRKNYLFAGSHQGAQRAAMMYTFFGSCKMNNINPYLWLKDVFERIQDHPINRIEELLPHCWKPMKSE